MNGIREEILALFLILGEKLSNFSPLSVILATDFLVDVFVRLRKFSSSPSLLRVFFFFFNHEWVLDFSNAFSIYIDRVM